MPAKIFSSYKQLGFLLTKTKFLPNQQNLICCDNKINVQRLIYHKELTHDDYGK